MAKNSYRSISTSSRMNSSCKRVAANVAAFALAPMSVADFYHALMAMLTAVRMPVQIYRKPVEMERQVPFDVDTGHSTPTMPSTRSRCWRILCSAADVFWRFRSRFYGKASPVHFFWGSFDLAVTRFSGRTAPPHPGGVPNLPDRVTRDAYSHEVSSCGFWPGGAACAVSALLQLCLPGARRLSPPPRCNPPALAMTSRCTNSSCPMPRSARRRTRRRSFSRSFKAAMKRRPNLGRWDRALARSLAAAMISRAG